MSHHTPAAVVKVKKADRTKDWPGCGETEPSRVTGGNITWHSHSRKQFGSFLKQLDIYLSSLLLIVQSLSCVQLFATPWTTAHQASMPFTISQSLLKIMSVESVMPRHDAMPSSVILFSSFAFNPSQNQGLF